MATKTKATTKDGAAVTVGMKLFGAVGNYPPATWRFTGVRNGSCILEHVKHPSASRGFPPQGVSWDEIGRLESR